MAVPDYQTLMLPLLKLHADGREWRRTELYDALANEFEVTEEQRAEALPSGRQSRFENRVGWAGTYLRKAGLLDSTGRGKSQLTPLGREVLLQSPPRINVHFLQQYASFQEFRRPRVDGDRASLGGEVPSESALDPEETIELGYQSLRDAF